MATLFMSVPAVATETRTVDRTLTITGEVDLDASTGPGSVFIAAGPAGVVRIHAVIRPLYGAADLGLADPAIQALEQKPPIEQEGNRIRVGYVNDPAVLGRVSITYAIEMPSDSRCRVATSSGGIRVDGIAGPASVESSSGRVDIEAVTKDVIVKNSAGAVAVRRSGSQVFVRTTSGGIQVIGAKGAVDVETSSGRTEVSDVAGTVNSRTRSGSIVIDKAAAATATDASAIV